MFYNPRSIFSAALVSLFALESSALDFKPLPPGTFDVKPGQTFKRDGGPAPIDLMPIFDPALLTHGRSMRRAVTGKEAFDPESESNFYWGAYAGDNIYVANFTLSNPGDDEFIMPVERFSKELKSIKCGKPGEPMILEFKDKDSFDYASSAWDWVNKEDINKFTLVTEPDQCYKGDNRSPYLVSNIKFDKEKLIANIIAEEKPWDEIAHTFHLKIGHQHVPQETANVTHPHLFRRDGNTMDITHSFNGELFNFAIDSLTTMGMAMSASAEINTAGRILTDFDIQKSGFFKIPSDINLSIQPQDVSTSIKLNLHADGTLGKAIDWSMTPEIDIPIAALNIAKIIQIGPFVTLGVHFGSSSLSGTGDLMTGATGTFDNAAKVSIMMGSPDQNTFENWTPKIDKIDPTFSAEFTGDLRTWAELAVVIKAEVLGKWGYSAGIEAQLPYFQANLVATKEPTGVCGTMKTVGIDVDTSVGIDVSLQAGPPNGAPNFRKEIWTTNWPLFTTCLAIGADNAVVATATETEVATETGEVTATETGEVTATETGTEVEPTGTETGLEETAVETGTDFPTETGEATAVETGDVTATMTATDSMITGTETEIIDEPTGTDSEELPVETEATATATDGELEPTQTGEETEVLETEFPTMTDGADMPAQTIYKTIYITEGGDDTATATDVGAEATATDSGEEATATDSGEEPTATEDLPEETEVPTESILPEDTAMMTTDLPEETATATATAMSTDMPEETELPTDTSAIPETFTDIASETASATESVDTSVPSITIAGVTGVPTMNATMSATHMSTMKTLVSSAPPPYVAPAETAPAPPKPEVATPVAGGGASTTPMSGYSYRFRN